MNAHSKSACLRPLGLCAIALLMGALSVHAQSPSPGSGIAPSPASAASATAPARPATGPASIATAPRWGDGVLEREFLIKLRTFLETDPFDMKALSGLLGELRVVPPNAPFPDGSWYARTVRVKDPLGGEYGNRGPGGAMFAYAHDRSSSYLRMEFVKVAFGDHEKSHRPCLTTDQFMEVFDAPGWTNGYLILRYADDLPVYGPRQFQTTAASGVAVRFIPQGGGGCSPYLTIDFDRLPLHPATRQ